MWGIDDWGAMLWGGSSQVPLMSPLGVAVLVILLVAGGVVMQRRHAPRWAIWALGAALVIPLAAYAGTTALPNTFTNGTVADANEVNANFDALVAELNSQNARIAALEALHSPPSACASAPCFSGVVCTDDPPPSTGYTCGACPPGYVGDGETCTPI